jgi:predicted amidohydrolase YtcJ
MSGKTGGTAEVGGFVDHHAHLLKTAARQAWPWEGSTVREFHQRMHRDRTTPMDIAEPPAPAPAGELASRLFQGLTEAAELGLVEITEMGMREWFYLDALNSLSNERGLPLRVRIYLASGLAESAPLSELAARRADAGPWIKLDGIKFYCDGWLVPRTCAVCRDFDDTGSGGLLFTDAATLARRIGPLAADGWRIATHAIGDLAVQTVLDAYELAWDHDRAAIAAAAPRIEHASLLPEDAIARMTELGVWACIQPSFPVTDDPHVRPALGAERESIAYPWTRLAEAGTKLLLGTDYPIEVIDPLAGLARLVNGRSDRPGYATDRTAPERSRLPLATAIALTCDESAGTTTLSAKPSAGNLDQLLVTGTAPIPWDVSGS